MTNRDEYVQKLKSQIEQWNAEAARWEEGARNAQAKLRRVQQASTDTFSEMMRGADAAMQSMADAFERARRSFDKK